MHDAFREKMLMKEKETDSKDICNPLDPAIPEGMFTHTHPRYMDQ